MKLIVGLGNPGKEYEKTRHNVGFLAIDHYIETNNLGNYSKHQFGEYIKCQEKGAIFAKPTTYMNLSGTFVCYLAGYFKINVSDIFVIYDDISFEIGKFKLKQNGTSGGHNGIDDIIKNFKTTEIKRLKIGIYSPHQSSMKHFVLSKFRNDELEKLQKLFETTDRIIESFLAKDFTKIQNEFNSK
ncbi:hypothetical protein ASO20_01610 [Mycoplasma sp. (ex Biomphalaria glabrata)]|uniref:aminoacyl-tRNA hydrolase n=1 Tax=Mycoplasma sp. (ex Biomphalaria glabrata) TaxID=1749074 RepID=UPI00073A545C|nr:aminoacyl-tRNA hydrolase [Mycoplasma sp. (ex Biomphalaria glabrata)]ALV23346.1 hypothetical protein ASO20_01610 [Mycoplasma sp. (ex Biomphalaria glabrata)]